MSTAGKTDEAARNVEEEFALLKMMRSRRGKLGALTRWQNEIQVLVDGDAIQNKVAIEEKMEKLENALEDFSQFQEYIVEYMSEEEKECDLNDWFTPKVTRFKAFIEAVKNKLKLDAHEERIKAITDAEHEPSGDHGHQDIEADKDSEDPEKAADAVQPEDSVSQHGSQKGSTTSSATRRLRVQAEADKAALMVLADMLKKKHQLKMEEATLKAKRESLQVEAEIAEATAKIKVLEAHETSSQTSRRTHSDAGKAYHDLQQRPQKTISKFTPLSMGTNYTLFQPVDPTYTSPGDAINSGQQQHSSSPMRDGTKPASGNTSHPDAGHQERTKTLVDVLSKQAEVSELIVKQQSLALLPSREITAFSGEPLQYQPFIQAFEHCIESKTDSDQDRLYYLEQFTSGQAKELVRSCLHLQPALGYKEARRLLLENFGHGMRITAAYMEKALGWPTIKVEDSKALHSYGLFLRGCYNALQSGQYLEEMNTPSNLKILLSKLPFKLRDKFRTVACDIQERHQRRASFKDLVHYIEKQARIITDPIFGDIQDPRPAKVTPGTKTLKPTAKRSSFVTTVATVAENTEREDITCPSPTIDHPSEQPVRKATRQSVENPVKSKGINMNEKPENKIASKKPCAFCSGDHTLEVCRKFTVRPHKEKVDFLRAKGACFGCLTLGHMSRDCKKRISCDICQKKHPALLHIKTEEDGLNREVKMAVETRRERLSNAMVSIGDHTGAGKDCALSILPVQIKHAKGNKIVQTYAFLDAGSTATFCTEELMHELNIQGQGTTILLKTMGQEKPVNCFKVAGLEVGDLHGETFMKLPEVYTHSEIPVTKENIPTQDDIKKWPYLKEVQLVTVDKEVGILIGLNCPKALEPWKVVKSEGNGPYAVRTQLGWVVNGPLESNPCVDDKGRPYVTANRISIANIEELLVQQYNQDFPEQQHKERSELSAEDKQFLMRASESAVLKGGHYYLQLPFRKDGVKMPRNRHMFKQDQVFF